MAEIINIADRRKKTTVTPTVQEVAQFAIEEIDTHWGKFASNNRLNDYFVQYTPSWSQTNVNYLEDLTALSVLERKIHLEPQIIAPGFSPDNALGWVAAFRMNGVVVATPFMMSEAYARCFNVLLYLKVKRDLLANGIQIS
jgi:hypothetical protein